METIVHLSSANYADLLFQDGSESAQKTWSSQKIAAAIAAGGGGAGGGAVIDDGQTSALTTWSSQKIAGDLAGRAPLVHNHDTLYYPRSTVDALLAGRAPLVHDHDAAYYPRADVDGLIAGRAPLDHSHAWNEVNKAGSALSDLSDVPAQSNGVLTSTGGVLSWQAAAGGGGAAETAQDIGSIGGAASADPALGTQVACTLTADVVLTLSALTAAPARVTILAVQGGAGEHALSLTSAAGVALPGGRNPAGGMPPGTEYIELRWTGATYLLTYWNFYA